MAAPLLERRDITVNLECRAADQGNKLVGVAAVYDTLSAVLCGKFREKIAKGAFDKSLKENRDIWALYAHDKQKVLGRTKTGTLKLNSTDKGLEFEIELPSTSYANDLKDLVRRGDISECSFGFICPPGGDTWDRSQNPFIRTLVEVELIEISMVLDPAYPDGTSAALRNSEAVYLQSMQRDRAQKWFAFTSLKNIHRRS